MKSDGEIMKMLAAYDLLGTTRAAAIDVGCSHHTVANHVAARDGGRVPGASAARERICAPMQMTSNGTDNLHCHQRARRFIEFANAVRRQRTIGVCCGQTGIGKTLSARRYANWSSEAETLVEQWGRREESDHQIYKDLTKTRTVFFTPGVLTTPKQIKEELAQLTTRTSICIDERLRTTGTKTGPPIGQDKHVELIIVDESERLYSTALEVLRDRYDRNNIALILIGMPGIEKQFSRYPQLYSRIGFAHEYRPLGKEELHFVLQRRWRTLGQTLNPEDFTDAQAVAAIARITRGNFRLIDRLFTQMQRVMKINELSTITDDVVEAAKSTIGIGIS